MGEAGETAHGSRPVLRASDTDRDGLVAALGEHLVAGHGSTVIIVPEGLDVEVDGFAVMGRKVERMSAGPGARREPRQYRMDTHAS